ncbi:hypothetical protein [Pelagibius sp. Alg239-R121]|uniref:hypothetical protein n=1 Tax=Pelagibius sp. Alg239-R121 TaxID=2993448 RepID=UPI0024A76667|nr:hypothetical protein [Pelagibius sp. Alg239-R121]
MRSFFARRSVNAFGEHYGYDVAFMHHILKLSPDAFFKFTALTKLAQHRKAAPKEAFYAAKLVGALTEDCGPCVQLVIDMAQEAGVPPGCVEAILQRNLSAMGVDTLIGYRFADALARRSPEQGDAREAVRQQWGEMGVLDLTFAVQIGRVFPMLKEGLGFAASCQRVRVGDQSVEVFKEVA